MIINKKIFVTGASGLVGKPLVKTLLAHNNEVFILVRRNSLDKVADLIKQGAKVIDGDLLLPDSYKRYLENIDYCFHLAAFLKLGSTKEENRRVNILGTDSFIEQIAKLSKKPRFIHFSSSIVSGFSRNIIDEKSHFSCKDYSWYAWSKKESEKIVSEKARRYSIPFTIVRPVNIYGPENFYGIYLAMRLIAKGKMKILIGTGLNKMHFIHVADVVAATTHLAALDESINEIYVLCDNEALNTKEMIYLSCKELEMECPKFSIPPILAKIVLSLPPISRALNMNRELVEYFYRDHVCSNSKLLATKYNFIYPNFRTAVHEVIQWYKKNNYF